MSALALRIQAELYGEILGPRFDRIEKALELSRRQLAQLLGVSVGAIDQLAHGRRVQLERAQYRRLTDLEVLAAELSSSNVRDDTLIARRLAEYASSDPSGTAAAAAAGPAGDAPESRPRLRSVGAARDDGQAGRASAVRYLSTIANPVELRAAAAHVPNTELGRLLHMAITGADYAAS